MEKKYYEMYDDIDVPDFMKNKNKEKQITTREEHEEEIEKAYIKGGFMGTLTTIVILGMMIFIAIIENM